MQNHVICLSMPDLFNYQEKIIERFSVVFFTFAKEIPEGRTRFLCIRP